MELQKINNATRERIEAMKAKVGMFCRWSLGLEGGVEGLPESGGLEDGEVTAEGRKRAM